MTHRLQPHNKIENISIDASLELTKQKIEISFSIKGVLAEYVFPPSKKIQRADEIWKATSFELFLANDAEEYYELNFSSSLAWNFYVLSSYRVKPQELVFEEEPHISYTYKNNEFNIVFNLESKAINFEKFRSYNLAAILLTEKKERTFWTINHLNDVPNFHNKESFKSL